MMPLPRRLGLAQGALTRRSDRVLVFVIAVLVLSVVPVWLVVESWAVGSATRTSDYRGQYVTAVLTENAPAGASTGEYGSGGKAQVKATWAAPDGGRRSGGIPAEPGMRAGQTVPLWTDESGRIAPAPAPPDEIRVQGQVVALIAALIWLMFVAVAARGVHAMMESLRLRAWGREWARVELFWRDLR